MATFILWIKRYSQGWHVESGHCSQGLEQMAEHVYDRDVDNGLELAQQGVGKDGAKDGGEVAEHGEGVVDHGGRVLSQVQLLLQVEGEDGLHAVVGESFTELIPDDEEDAFGVGQLGITNMSQSDLMSRRW